MWLRLINAKWMACVTGRELFILCAVLPQGPSALLEERLCPAVSNSGSNLPLLSSQVPLTAAAAAAEAEWGKERERFADPSPPPPWSCAASAAAAVCALHEGEGGVGSGSLFWRIPCKEQAGRCDDL